MAPGQRHPAAERAPAPRPIATLADGIDGKMTFQKKTKAIVSMNYNEKTLEDAVVARLDCKDARFKNVMTSLIRNLHTFVREVEPSEEEW